MKRIVKLLSVLSAVILMSSCIGEDPVDVADIKVGDLIPDFTVEMNDGSTITGEQLRKGVSLIMFFHTDCPDCAVTLPEVQKIYNEYSHKNVRFALISREEEASAVSLYWRANHMTMLYSAQSDRKIYNLFAESRIPRVYISIDGVVKAVFTDNPNPKYEDMKAVLEGLI